MAKVYADVKFVGNWKCTSKLKKVLFNKANMNFPEISYKFISISNTPAGTIMYLKNKSGSDRGIPAVKAYDNGQTVEFIYKGKNEKFELLESIKISMVDNANLVGESVSEWTIPGKGVVAKVISRNDYHRMGRMRTPI